MRHEKDIPSKEQALKQASQQLSLEEIQRRASTPGAPTWEKEYYEDMEAHWNSELDYSYPTSGWDVLIPMNDDDIDALERYAG